MRPVKILAYGDHFVTPELMTAALRARLGAAAELTCLVGPWPLVPFGRVSEVDEASDTEDELIAALPGVQVLVTQMGPVTERVLAAAPDLELVVVCRGGPVNVNAEAAARHGVAVRSTPGRNAVAAAEHAVALLLAALRQIPQVHETVREGQWRSELYALDAAGSELAGSTVGLVGYGAIGARVGRILRAFDAAVVVHDPYLDPASVDGVRLVDLDELLAASDAVSLHARLTAENRHMVGAAQIARMRRGAVLVNTARGGLLDYDAVVDALESGHLGAAAFDVYPAEPLPPDFRLLKAPRTVLTPHLAGATRQTAQRAADLAAAQVADFLAVPGRA